jgi:membrane protease YdiL (CAAX protease family)
VGRVSEPAVFPPPWATSPPPAPRHPVAVPLTGRDRKVVRVELVVMAAVAAAPGLVAGLVGLGQPQTVDIEVSTLDLVAAVLFALGPAFLVLYLLWRDGQLRTAGLGPIRAAPMVGFSLLAWVLAVVALYAVTIVLLMIYAVFSGGELESTPVEFEVDAGTVITALVFSVTAGISEEIVYRGYGITRMEQAGWPRAALFVPLLVWTALHLYQGLIAIPIIGSIGVVFVFLFRWRRSVWPLMVGHALYDITIFAVAMAVR